MLSNEMPPQRGRGERQRERLVVLIDRGGVRVPSAGLAGGKRHHNRVHPLPYHGHIPLELREPPTHVRRVMQDAMIQGVDIDARAARRSLGFRESRCG